MDKRLQDTCDLFVENWELLKGGFKREHDKLMACACIYQLSRGMTIDIESLKTLNKEYKPLIKKIPDFKNAPKFPLLCKMMTEKEPEKFFNKVKHIDELLQVFPWLFQDYRAFSSMIIAECSTGDENDDKNIRYYLNEAGDVYGRLKEEYGKDLVDQDYAYACMLAASDYEVEPLMEEVFSTTRKLSKIVKKTEAARAMAYVLSAGDEDTEEKYIRSLDILKEIREAGVNIGAGYELTLIAALSMLDLEPKAIAMAFVQVEEYLRTEKHCRGFNMKPGPRKVFTALCIWLTFQDYFEESKNSVFRDSILVMATSDVILSAFTSSPLEGLKG